MKFYRQVRGYGLAVLFLGVIGAVSVSAQSGSLSKLDLDNSSGGGQKGSDLSSLLSGRQGTPSAGSDFTDMSAAPQTFISDFPVDEASYIVGPGDLFQIVVEGASFEKYVNPEGNLVLNRVGVARVKGLSLKDAKKVILDNLETSYKRRNCFVSLARPKDMRVFVTGAVNAPGIYEITGVNRVSDVLRKAGGYSVMAQKGTVEIRENGKSRTLLTSAFMMKGDLAANPYLTPGAVLFVPYVDYNKPWVRVKGDSGSFTVQLEANENLNDLVMKAYSYQSPPNYLALLVQEKGGKEKVLSVAEAAQYKPRSEAVIEIFSSKLDVFVGGAVIAPGRQPYRPDQKIIEYISRSGLLTSSKLPSKISVLRSNGARETLSLQDSGVRPGDVILVGQNAEQKFLIYTPILLSVVSLALVYLQISGQ